MKLTLDNGDDDHLGEGLLHNSSVEGTLKHQKMMAKLKNRSVANSVEDLANNDDPFINTDVPTPKSPAHVAKINLNDDIFATKPSGIAVIDQQRKTSNNFKSVIFQPRRAAQKSYDFTQLSRQNESFGSEIPLNSVSSSIYSQVGSRFS